MFRCAPKVGLSTTPIPNQIIQVLQKVEELQAHLNDQPSENTPDNVNSILVPIDCEHECTIWNSLFQTNEQDKYTCEFCTRSNQIQRKRMASGNCLSKQAERVVSRSNQILRPIDI
jgi:uncharacterized Fe-S radical SAM superfamily protein PflX